VHVASQAANIYGDEKSSLTYYVVSSFVAFALSGAYASSSTWTSYATANDIKSFISPQNYNSETYLRFLFMYPVLIL